MKLGSQTLPSILIGSALVSLLAGFYVYYQNGGGAVSGMTAEASSESVEPDESTDEPEEETKSDEEVAEDEDKREIAIPKEESSEED